MGFATIVFPDLWLSGESEFHGWASSLAACGSCGSTHRLVRPARALERPPGHGPRSNTARLLVDTAEIALKRT
jgi:hypothetical protein